MSLTIIGGMFRGFKLKVPVGVDVRPTSILLKRRLFDSQQNLTGKTFIDLCAGSGAIGFEALSRGADECIWVEKNQSVIKVLNGNLQKLKTSYNEIIGRIDKADFKKWLIRFQRKYNNFDESKKLDTILFFDPPYEQELLYDQFVQEIFNKKWFCGEVWIESDVKKGIPLNYWDQVNIKIKKTIFQGDRYFILAN